MLSQGNGAASGGPSAGTAGKKTAGSYKHSDTDHVIGGPNNLILSRGRTNHESTARAPPNVGQMNYSKTLTQHMQHL